MQTCGSHIELVPPVTIKSQEKKIKRESMHPSPPFLSFQMFPDEVGHFNELYPSGAVRACGFIWVRIYWDRDVMLLFYTLT